MNPFKNLKSFSGIVTIAILSGIIGSILITSFLMWKEVETFNGVDVVVKVQDDVEEGKNEWQTYTNEEYGYSIKHPAKIDLIVDRILERGTQGNPGFKLEQGGHFAIGVYSNENKNTAEEWLDYKYKEYSDGWSGAYHRDLINDINTVRATLDNRKPEDPHNCYIEWFIFKKGNNFYTIAGEFCNADQSSIDLFQNIASSFKFLEDDWLTYRNEELGFAVQYPVSWSVEYIEQLGGYYSIQSPEKYPWDSMASPDSPLYIFNILTFTGDVSSLNLDNASLVSINGVEGIRGREEGVPYRTVVILQKENQEFKLQWPEFATTATIEKMLSTFEFLEYEKIDTSDWETYVSQYGFQFSYPKSYIDNDGYGIWWTGKTNVGILENFGINKGLESIFNTSVYPKEKKGEMFEYYQFEITDKTITIDGEVAKQVKRSNTQHLGNYDILLCTYILEKENYVIQFGGEFCSSPETEQYREYKKILSTLKFLDEDTNTLDVSSWPTYINNDWEFSLEFPETWKNYQAVKKDKVFSFKLPEIHYGLFNIFRYNKEKWQLAEDAHKNGEQPSPGRYLGERGGYVYAAAVSQDLYYRQDLLEEIPVILDTFKFLDEE